MSPTNEVDSRVRRAALLNAFRHGGKAETSAVIGKVLAERPYLKPTIRELARTCSQIVDEINQLSPSDQKRILEQDWPDLLLEEKRLEERILPPLPNVEEYAQVVTRFSPNPDCVLHLGSTRAIILSHEYARMYDGRFVLRFEDTDPRLKRPRLEFYDLIEQDILWLGCKWDEKVIQSDRMELYYECAKKLLETGGAYVCTCSREDFRNSALASKACQDRNLKASEHLARWEKMLNGTYSEKEALIRMKTDLNHPNPAVRDWPALRIIDTEKSPHPRVGSRYRVWPLYNMACGVDDHLLGISHVIRGKEHLTNEVRQRFMYNNLGWKYPETLHYGRLKVIGAELSKSRIIKLVEEKAVSGFSDPRLATLSALRRRGIVPDTLRHLIIEIGPRPVDATLSWKNIYAINRKIVDDKANRFFYLKDPVRMVVEGVDRTYVSRPALHPDHTERGRRSLEVRPMGGKASILISSQDSQKLERGKLIRLMELFNVEVTSARADLVEAVFRSEDYEGARKIGAPLIQWLPMENNVPVDLVMADGEAMKGLGEKMLSQVVVGEIVQLVRVGFGRVDRQSADRVEIFFAHS